MMPNDNPAEEQSDVEWLRDLAARLFHVPALYGTDEGDVDRCNDLARKLEAFGKTSD